VTVVTWEVELYGPRGAGYELDRLEAGPIGRAVGQMEAALALGYTITEARVHVITGKLKGSGHPHSSFTGDTWDGVINFDRDPGIFELARGDVATKYHPYPGRHYFFDPGGHEFEKGVRQAVWDWVTDWEGGDAPDGGLSWASGGS
jgi:hypothetical protein